LINIVKDNFLIKNSNSHNSVYFWFVNFFP
jgi:hypothetical protein